jgi:hypothetical protein
VIRRSPDSYSLRRIVDAFAGALIPG